jgi:hypothetical protein
VVDRRAIIVGSWLSKGRNKPSPQRIGGITRRWSGIFNTDRYGWRSTLDPESMPEPLHNPSKSDLFAHIMESRRVRNDTELLFHFVGHSTSVGDDDIALILSLDEDGENRVVRLSTLVNIVRETFSGPLTFILDTCHAGRARSSFAPLRDRAFAMFSAGDAYAFNADFSDMLLRALEAPITKNDQRIDRKLGGMTYTKLFQDVRRRLIVSSATKQQDPVAFGDEGVRVILEASAIMGEQFNPFASTRSIYGRAREMLLLVGEGKRRNVLIADIRGSDAFVLDRNGAREITDERIGEYIAFLHRIRWLVEPGGVLTPTDRGRSAMALESYNRHLIEDIEAFVLPGGVKLADLDALVTELLDDLIPPTPGRLRERAAMNGRVLELDAATRLALSILPSTGRYLKGSADAIFPSERG